MSNTRSTGIQIGPVGVRIRRRPVVAASVLIVVVIMIGLLCLFTGPLAIGPDRVVAALSGQGTSIERLVVVDRRLARTLSAVLVGFALGVSGALTQSITRNPIASPDILGVIAGAGMFAVLSTTHPGTQRLLSALDPRQAVFLSALVGGMLTTGLILALSWRAGFDGLRLILVGLSINALALAGTSFLIIRANVDEAAIAIRWLTGSLAGTRLSDVTLLSVLCVAGWACSIFLVKGLAGLRMGREVSRLIGISPGAVEAFSLIVAVALVAVATAVAGPIAFVAFVAPQAALRLMGCAGPPPVAAGLLGAALVLISDLIAQRLPVELPVGVVTAVIGSPYLLHLLLRQLRRTHA